MSQPHPREPGGAGWGREKGDDTESLHFHLSCPLPKQEESEGEGLQGTSFIFTCTWKESVTLPLPFSGGVFQPLHTPLCLCTHTPQLGGLTGLPSPLTYFPLKTAGQGRKEPHQAEVSAMERKKGGRGAAPEARREWKGPQLLF